jgi:Fe-S-cluster containining protein
MINHLVTKNTQTSTIKALAPPCTCRKCSHGCTMGSGVFVEGETAKLAQFMGITEETLKKEHLEEVEMFNKKMWRPRLMRKGKPYGQCVFYKKKRCSIHDVKPLQCQISMGCKDYGDQLHSWFMLNHVLNRHDPEAMRQYESYIASGGTVIPGGSMREMIPNKTMREKIRNYEVLK